MEYKVMTADDCDSVVPFYIEYYNSDGGCWEYKTAYKRIHQVLTTEDSYCLAAVENGKTVGFIMGYFQQYDDLISYMLAEIVIAPEYQNRGIGTALMLEIEYRAEQLGASMIQLDAVNDEMHKHFYEEKLNYKRAGNFLMLLKFLREI